MEFLPLTVNTKIYVVRQKNCDETYNTAQRLAGLRKLLNKIFEINKYPLFSSNSLTIFPVKPK